MLTNKKVVRKVIVSIIGLTEMERRMKVIARIKRNNTASIVDRNVK